MSDDLKVAVRVRPFNEREKLMNATSCIKIIKETQQTVIIDPETSIEKSFTFDFSYNSFASADSPEFASQDTVWNDLGIKVLEHAWEGFNVSLFAYGQTGSGKSFSMVGYGEEKGIIPRACEVIFERINNNDSDTTFKVEASMMEIYNEKVKDLFHPSSDNLKVRDHPKKGPYAEGLTKTTVQSYNEINKLMDNGISARTTAATNMNATSSRAHTIFQIILTQSMIDMSTQRATDKVSRINLIDLAGSERATSTGATGDRLKEGAAINQSLSALGNCISALADNANSAKKTIVPYRNSKLTHLLKDSLGGNAKTIMIAALSPASVNYSETLSTLRYADRAKQIKNKAIINEDPNQKLIRQLKEELENLRKALILGGATKLNLDPNINNGSGTNIGTNNATENGFSSSLASNHFTTVIEGSSPDVSRLVEQAKNDEMNKIKEQLEQKQKLLEEKQNVLQEREKSWIEKIQEIEETAKKREQEINHIGQETLTSAMKEKNEMENKIKLMEEKMKIEQKLAEEKVINQKREWEEHVYKLNEEMKKQEEILRQKMVNESDNGMVDNKKLSLALAEQENKLAEKLAKAEIEYEEKQKKLIEKQIELEKNLKKQMEETKLVAKKKERETYEKEIIFKQLVNTISLVNEANNISEILKKGKKYQIILYCATPENQILNEFNIKSHENLLENIGAEPYVQIFNNETDTNPVSCDIEKFYSMVYIMRQMYQNYIDTGTLSDLVPMDEEDPFLDIILSQLIGRSFICIQTLYYGIDFCEEFPIFDNAGNTSSFLTVSFSILIKTEKDQKMKEKEILPEDDNQTDPNNIQIPTLHDYIGESIEIEIKVLNIKGIPDVFSSDVFIEFSWYEDEDHYVSDIGKINKNNKEIEINYIKGIKLLLDQNSIKYIENGAILFSVYGSPKSSLVSRPMTAQNETERNFKSRGSNRKKSNLLPVSTQKETKQNYLELNDCFVEKMETEGKKLQKEYNNNQMDSTENNIIYNKDHIDNININNNNNNIIIIKNEEIKNLENTIDHQKKEIKLKEDILSENTQELEHSLHQLKEMNEIILNEKKIREALALQVQQLKKQNELLKKKIQQNMIKGSSEEVSLKKDNVIIMDKKEKELEIKTIDNIQNINEKERKEYNKGKLNNKKEMIPSNNQITIQKPSEKEKKSKSKKKAKVYTDTTFLENNIVNDENYLKSINKDLIDKQDNNSNKYVIQDIKTRRKSDFIHKIQIKKENKMEVKLKVKNKSKTELNVDIVKKSSQYPDELLNKKGCILS